MAEKTHGPEGPLQDAKRLGDRATRSAASGTSSRRARKKVEQLTDAVMAANVPGWHQLKPNLPPVIQFRPYQSEPFFDRETGVVIYHWSRQIGKSFTLAAWAVDRLLSRPGRLVTVLSNSKDNGAEFMLKCEEVARLYGVAYDKDQEPDTVEFENMRFEMRIAVEGKIGRIKVLAASPRTARGFSGDLILDEFAFHEDSAAIWEAAEPILSSNPDFLCRIASTGNGKHNMFYRMATSGQFKVVRVTRTNAWQQGVKIYHPSTRQPITPDEARALALDKRAYDQNYECSFADENMVLLTHELISAAERIGVTVDEQQWTSTSIARMWRAQGELFAGMDFGRNRDLSVLVVIEKLGRTKRVIAMLRMADMRTPAQQRQADIVCGMPKFAGMELDMTGNGLGLTEYLQEKWGTYRIRGVNFASKEPITNRILAEGRKAERALVTEIMATDLLAEFEDRTIEIPADNELHNDLRKPEKITSPGGRVSIAAVRDAAGHADHFWGLALAVRACGHSGGPVAFQRSERLTQPVGLGGQERIPATLRGCLC